MTLDVKDLSDRDLMLVLIGEQRQTNAHLNRLNGSVADHSAQLRDLSKWRYLVSGGLIVISLVILPLLIDYVGAHIK
ncbi:MAG: hypothetical protein C4534_08200 [Gaiellales bacterium]|nr:MAG: hypothetical protein C4534_08200 [Gaiellales bacterium]